MLTHFFRRALVLFYGLLFILPVVTVPVFAQTLTVTNTDDDGPGSLRQTIAAAPSGAEIRFDPALHGQTLYLTSGELYINKTLDIIGPGADLFTIHGSASMRHFFLDNEARVLIEGLTLTEGFAASSGELNHNQLPHGGSIYHTGQYLEIRRCHITSNFARGQTFGESGGDGGGIYSEGVLKVIHSTISHNYAGAAVGTPGDEGVYQRGGFGGGIYSKGLYLIIYSSTISNNSAGSSNGGLGGHGGGIFDDGSGPIIYRSTVVGNKAGRGSHVANAGNGGGIYSSPYADQKIRVIASTIVAQNTVIRGGEGPDFYGEILWNNGKWVSNHNLFGIKDGIQNAHQMIQPNWAGTLADPLDPILTPLQDNGGPTPTHMPVVKTQYIFPNGTTLILSPALDAGRCDAPLVQFPQPPVEYEQTDQRGYGHPTFPSRGVDHPVVPGRALWPCDIGAVEANAVEQNESGGKRAVDPVFGFEEANLPGTHRLSDAYPNPFNPQTTLTLEVADEQTVRLDVYDVSGRLVETLHDGLLHARNEHHFRFDGGGHPSGIYLIRVVGQTFTETRRVMLVK